MCADQQLNPSCRTEKAPLAEDLSWNKDPLYEEAKAALPDGEAFPVSFLQRRFRLGYARACRLYRALLTSQ